MPIIPDYNPYRGGEHRPSVGSPRMAGLVGEANAKLGGEIGEAASSLIDTLRRRLADVQDEGARNESELIVSRGLKSFAEHRRANPDGKSWQPELQSTATGTGSRLAELPASEPVKREIQEKADARFREAGRESEAEAQAGIARKARQSLTDNVERLKAEGKFGEAIERIRSGVDKQLLSAAEGRADEDAARGAEVIYRKKSRFAELGEEVDRDPTAMLERLNAVNDKGEPQHEVDLEPSMRAQLVQAGKDTLVRRRADEFRTISHAIQQGPLTEQEIMELPEYLGDGTKENLLAHARRVQPPDAAEATKAWHLLDKVGEAFVKWQDGGLGEGGYMEAFAAAQEQVMAMVPPGWSGRLRGALEAFAPERLAGAMAQGSAMVAERHRKLIEIRVRNMANGARDSDLLGDMWVTEDRAQAERSADEAVAEITRWLDGEKAPDMKAAEERMSQELERRKIPASVRKIAGVMPGSLRAFSAEQRAVDAITAEEAAAEFEKKIKTDGESNR